MAVYGYKLSEKSACELDCRHGGTCMFLEQESCECVEKWGWRGITCALDVDGGSFISQAILNSHVKNLMG